MLVRLGCCVLVAAAMLAPTAAQANCAEEVARIMSRETEKLNTRYQRVAKRNKGQAKGPKQIAEECRVARQLQPRLERQLAALKQLGCRRDPDMSAMIADLIRGHEDDLAQARLSASRSECR
jgi:hypothetical protein